MENQLSYLGIEPPLKYLRLGGFYPLPDDNIFHKLYRNLIFLSIVVVAIQQLVYVFQVRHDVESMIETLLLLLSYFDCLCKQVATRTGFSNLESMIQIMKGPVFNQGFREHKELLTSNVRKVRLIFPVYVGSALVAALFWALNYVQLFVQGKDVNFNLWLPFDGNVNSNFYIAMIYITIQVFIMTFNNASTDIFISFLMAQIRTQLSILKLDLINVVKKSKEEAKLSSEPWHDVYKRHFRRIMSHYQEIVQFTEMFQSVYSGALLCQFIVSGWIMCTTLYNAVHINPASAEFVSMAVYLLCVLAELFLFCHFGNEIFWESDALLNYAYQMDWTEIPTNFRKELIIFMERIKRPLEPTAGGIIPLSNSTFVSITRSSYSFYLVLKNTS